MSSGNALTKLRRQLVDMESALIEKLAHKVSGDSLALLGSVHLALLAVEDMRDGGGRDEAA